MVNNGVPELYRRYRPAVLKAVLGQPQAVKVLGQYMKDDQLPHVVLLIGPSGVGKTTIARILARWLECGEHDLVELNCADSRGIDAIREIRQSVPLAPIDGPVRVYILDEVAATTGSAQTMLLKMLEDMPDHAYYFLCTTDPQKLLKTIRTRCCPITLASINDKDMTELLEQVIAKEEATISTAVVDKIVAVAEGSARQALVLLDQIIALGDEQEQLDCVQSSDTKRQAWAVVKALLYEKTNWSKMAKLLKETDVGDAEQFRHMVLSCANTEMLKGGPTAVNAYTIATIFADPWYNCPKSGLTRACFEVLNERK